MSESHSTPACTRSKPASPPEPTPALTPAPGKPAKPEKPYPDFPLFPHAAHQWAKKIRGRTHYFGPWEDPDAALAKYNKQKDALHSGKTPKPQTGIITVKELANQFMDAKQVFVDSGELSPRTLTSYRQACRPGSRSVRCVATGDRPRPGRLREAAHKAGEEVGTVPTGQHHPMRPVPVQVRIRFRSDSRAGPVRSRFARPSKKVIRLHRAAQGAKLFTSEEVNKLLALASPAMRAMILLGINCGFGNADCGTLPLIAANLSTGWIDFPRPKTGVARRCRLWPETVQAIRNALAKRPTPKDAADAGLVFVTKYGESWAKDVDDSPITKEMRKLLNKAGINGHRNFYTLRHTFRTIADAAKDQPAADFIMGHEAPHMSSHYREGIDDARLNAVAEHVRSWLFSPAVPETCEEGR